MQTIKKVYQEIYALLNDNQDKTVKTLMPELLELMQRQKNSSGQAKNHHTVEGEVVAVFCWYHKKWESAEHYGKKANSTTGLNTFCREGVSVWTKHQRLKKQIESELLQDVMNGTVQPADLPAVKAERMAELDVIVPRQDGHGYDTLDELLKEL